MAKTTTMQNSLTSGEWSPRAKGRTDLSKYASGAGKMENFLINQVGGAFFRPGTRFIAETKHSAASEDKKSRLIPFQYQADQDYVIEMGENYFKLYENDSDLVTDSQTDPYTKLLIHANGVDAYGNKGGTVIDVGNTVHAITKVGTAAISPSQYKLGNCALTLDGDSDYLTAVDHVDWSFGAGNFTVECFIRFDTISQRQMIMGQREDAGNFWFFEIQADNKLNLQFKTGGGAVGQYTMTNAWSGLAVDTWYHVAGVRNGIVGLIFIDGVEQTVTEVTAFAANNVGDVAKILEIGHIDVANLWLDGWIDEFRISKGTARYTAGFTPTTTEFTSDATTVLLLHMNTQDHSSATVPKITEFVGTAQFDTAQYKDLTGYTETRASLLLDGNSDWLQVPDSADFDFDDGDFTLECFVRFAGIGAQQNLFGQYEDANNYWYAEITAANKLQFIFVDDGVTKGDYITDDAIAGLAINTWYHFVFVRSTTGAYIFVNGTAKDITETTAFAANDVGDMVEDLKIGAYGPDAGEGRFFNGWMDEIRIKKGQAKWTANFTSTTAEYALEPLIVTEITTTYAEDDIFDIQYAQNNDILYLVHPDYAPRKLSRTSATAFSLSIVSFVRGPFMDTNIETTTITPSADAGAAITLTASVATFDALHVNSLWRVKSGVVKITAHTNSTLVTGDVQAEPDGTAGDLATGPAATTDWAEGAFSGYRGYPSAIAFHEQRLYYANTEEEPQKFWGSYIGAYDSFDTTATTDDYSLTVEVATEQRNAIKWMSSGNRALALGTTGGTFSASSSDSLEAIAPDNIVVSRDTNYGVAGIMPKRISSFLYYAQRDLARLRELSYSFEIDSTISSDMTLLAEHILRDGDGVVDLDHQQAPNDRIFCVRDDGEMAVLTRNPEQEVMGWCRFVAGTDAQGVGEFETVCVIPKSETDDQVWVIVKRNINGTTKRFIEFFMTEDFDEDWDAVRCDSSLTLDSPLTITAATAADPVVVTSGTHGLSNGDQIKINGVVGMIDLNGEVFLVANKTADTFELTDTDSVDIDGSGYDAYISGGEARKMVTNIAGLDHLVGEVVTVQADGYIPTTETYTVQAGGSITLPAKAAVVHAGLPYTGTIQLLKLSEGSPTGTGQTRMRRIFKGTLRLDRSHGLSIGRTTSTLDDLAYDEDVLYTGDMKKVFQTTWDDADEIIIQQAKALPANILAIILRSETSEG